MLLSYPSGRPQPENIQPSSAAFERVFSLLKNSFGVQQDNALKDYVEASLMLQFNKR